MKNENVGNVWLLASKKDAVEVKAEKAKFLQVRILPLGHTILVANKSSNRSRIKIHGSHSNNSRK